MTTQEHAKYLNNTYGWNIVPMYYFQRDIATGDKSVKLIDWHKYKSESYNLDTWQENYKALMIITGQISDLTVLDIDSQEALDTILNALGLDDVTDLAEYVVKTYKGFQLFYTYEPNTTTRIGIKDKIDFLNGGATFAVDTNQSYTTIKENKPQPMPQALKDLILDNELECITDDVKDFERALRENSDLPYKTPLQPLIKDFIDAGKIGRKIKAELEKVFCTKDYTDYSLDDFSKRGQIHTSMLYVGAIVAANPTVSESLTIDFMRAWATKIAKIDLTDLKEQQLLQNRIKGCMNYFRYDINWKQRAEDLNNPSKQAIALGFNTWYNPVVDKYAIYHPANKTIDWYSKTAFKDAIVRDLKEQDPESPVKPSEVDVTKVKKMYETFNPTVDDEFYIDPDTGLHMHNNFKRSQHLTNYKKYRTEHNAAELPEFLGNVLNHVYPNSNERAMFLHTLAYHMTYLHVSPTCYILTGKSGTGKNIILQQVLSEIYGSMYLVTTAASLTGRFRNQLKDKLLVFIDEVNEKRHKETAQGSFHNVIKQIVANKTIEIESKGKDTEVYPNHSLFVMASNQDNPIKLEEGFDRRINITKTNDENLQTLSWFPHHLSREERDVLIKDEVDQLVRYLATIELDKAKWDRTIENTQRQNLISNSIPIVDQYANAILNKDYNALSDIDVSLAEWLEDNEDRASIPNAELKNQIGDLGAKIIKKLQDMGVAKKKVNNKWCLVLNPAISENPFKNS